MQNIFGIKNNKNKYLQIYLIFFLVIFFVLFFRTSLGETIVDKILIWKSTFDNKKEQKIVLNDFYYFENLELKERLDYQEKNNKQRKLFSIIVRGENNIYDTFLINDPQEILRKGDLVVGRMNFALGRVVESGPVSKFKLFSSVGEKNIFFLNDSEKRITFDVEATGEGSGILKVILPREVEVSKNTVLQLVEHKEYLIAKLVKEEFKTQDPDRILYFQILVNPYGLNRVEVEK